MGYIILLAAIGSMVAILVHERKRIKEIEAESAEIRQVRRSINTAHRRITGLATLGEGVVNWNKADYLYYRNRRLQADSLLNLLKRHCREYVRPEQIDTLRALLAEKETHLLHIMEMFERRTEADSVLVNQLPEVARRATHIRTIEQKKKGIAGFFGKKEEIQDDSDWAAMREAQAQALHLNHTGMVVTTDIGKGKSNTFQSTLETGLRLSQLALKQTYGKRKMPQYPVYKGYSIEGNTLRIHLENLGKGFLHPDPVRGFIIAGTDRIFYPATVTVKKKEIIVQSPDVPHPVAVRYNWANHTDGTLFGASGLPVAPFRTDNW